MTQNYVCVYDVILTIDTVTYAVIVLQMLS